MNKTVKEWASQVSATDLPKQILLKLNSLSPSGRQKLMMVLVKRANSDSEISTILECFLSNLYVLSRVGYPKLEQEGTAALLGSLKKE